MYANIVKKFMGLLAVYTVVIVGIFVVQFKWPVLPSAQIEHAASTHTDIAPARDDEATQAASVQPAPPFTYANFSDGNAALPAAVFAASTAKAYEQTITALDTALVTAFNAALASPLDITEEQAVSFVAVYAKSAGLTQAIAAVPPQIKRAASRTYLSAPYFGSLASTYRSLEAALQSARSTLALANGKNRATVFEALNAERLADYIALNSTSPDATSVLHSVSDICARDDLSVMEAATVLCTYCELDKRNTNAAKLLERAVPSCLETIEKHITIDEEALHITDDTPLDYMMAAKVGAALIQTGKATGNDAVSNTGRAIINTCISPVNLTLQELSALSALISTSPYYPHMEVLSLPNQTYAWTCASSIKRQQIDNSVNLDINAPSSSAHYIIVCGIKPFNSIYIYGVPYRADQKFETYNSSGFVYIPATNTLLIKSRHKTQTETIRLVYSALNGGQ